MCKRDGRSAESVSERHKPRHRLPELSMMESQNYLVTLGTNGLQNSHEVCSSCSKLLSVFLASHIFVCVRDVDVPGEVWWL